LAGLGDYSRPASSMRRPWPADGGSWASTTPAPGRRCKTWRRCCGKSMAPDSGEREASALIRSQSSDTGMRGFAGFTGARGPMGQRRHQPTTKAVSPVPSSR
jgi:hypothetical protein